MNVLMITSYPAIEGKIIGGVQSVATTLVPALLNTKEIDNLYVLCFYVGQPPLKSNIQKGKINIFFRRAPNFLEAPTFFLVDNIRAWMIANRVHPDLIHGQGLGKAGYIATHLGYPSVVTVHGISSREALLEPINLRNNIRIWLANRRVESILRNANTVISTTKYDRKIVNRQVSGQHLLIHNPVSSEYFNKENHDYSNNKPDTYEILFAGTLIPRKNIIGIIRAFKDVLTQIPNANLTLLGPQIDQSYLQKCRSLTEELGLTPKINFLGHVGQEELIDRLRKCACLVMFSNEETSPTIIMQAMAMGKPVVASSVGGIPELVDPENTGYLVNKQDEIDLSQKLIALLRDDQGRFRMGNKAREFALENFNPAKVAALTVEAYRFALGHQG